MTSRESNGNGAQPPDRPVFLARTPRRTRAVVTLVRALAAVCAATVLAVLVTVVGGSALPPLTAPTVPDRPAATSAPPNARASTAPAGPFLPVPLAPGTGSGPGAGPERSTPAGDPATTAGAGTPTAGTTPGPAASRGSAAGGPAPGADTGDPVTASPTTTVAIPAPS
ncbi:MAG TPA: hypothetical protein VFM01_09600, partial [Nakamurella sp.]|nr:hypothetical protein [Nakamurella sp.]